MKNLITITFVILTFLFVFTNKTNADCQPVYGGGQTCTGNNQLTITKTVLNPKTNKLVTNLGINDPKYHPNDIINFQIKIQNSGSNSIAYYTIKDTFPQGFVFSDALGSFDSKTNTLTITGGSFNSGQTADYTITGRISPNANSACINNQASVYIDNNTSQTSIATSQFCIEGNQTNSIPTPQPTTFVRQPTTTRQNPPTGLPTEILIGLLGMGALGGMLRIYSNKI